MIIIFPYVLQSKSTLSVDVIKYSKYAKWSGL